MQAWPVTHAGHLLTISPSTSALWPPSARTSSCFGSVLSQWKESGNSKITRVPTPNLPQIKNACVGTSLVAQWLRIRLPMQGTRVRALVWEDPTCRGATKPVRHNYWACALKPVSHSYWARVPQLLKPARLEPVLRSKRSPHTATRGSPRTAAKIQHSQK